MPTIKINQLVNAMATHEGWIPPNASNNFLGSASYRRHNPLNLRKSRWAISEDNGFCVFASDEAGYLAAQFDIFCKAIGYTNSGLNGKSTIADLIRVWAPPSDNNNTEAYINAVLTATGWPSTMTLESLLTA